MWNSGGGGAPNIKRDRALRCGQTLSGPVGLLNGRPFGDAIEKGLMGYATQNLTEVMPPTPQNPGSPEYDRIVAAFF